MEIKPHNQTNLYGLKRFFVELTNLYNAKKMPNKILLSGTKGTGKSTLAYHFINYIFSQNEEFSYDLIKNEINKSNKSFKLIENFTHPNFYLIDLIDGKKKIEISQIRTMIDFANKSSFSIDPKIILIDNVENLNINSSNALLKIIEEPNHNAFFILIHNNNKHLLSTLKSRCLNFKINLSFDETIHITNKILDDNIFNLLNYDLINYYNSPGDYIDLVNFSKDKNINLNDFTLKKFLLLIIDENYYKKNNFIKLNIYNYIELYFLKIFNQSKNKNKVLSFYTKFIYKINNANNFNLDFDSLFIEFKSKILNE